MKISIIGAYARHKKNPCGQMIKVRTLCSALQECAPKISIDVVDTFNVSSNPFWVIWHLLKALFWADKIIFLAAERGRVYMFPFFYYVTKMMGTDIYYDSIGGATVDEMPEHPRWVKYLNAFKANWFESVQEVKKMKAYGVNNAKYLPNFKCLKAISEEELKHLTYDRPYRFCTFCRVEPMKGIEDALQAIRYVNEKCPNSATLDVYGLIQPGEEDWFESIKREYKNEFRYCGVVGYSESAQAIAPYLAMLFPTRYRTEGMPGTIVDSMFAAVPVIARRWCWCDNMLTDGYNGLVYDFDKPEELNEILLNVCQNTTRLLSLKQNCLQEARKYSREYNLKQILADMDIA